MKRRRRGQEPERWADWVADNMQQRERELSPFEKSTPSALILVPLLGLPVVLIVGLVITLLLK